jgi:hypothetical protein
VRFGKWVIVREVELHRLYEVEGTRVIISMRVNPGQYAAKHGSIVIPVASTPLLDVTAADMWHIAKYGSYDGRSEEAHPIKCENGAIIIVTVEAPQ